MNGKIIETLGKIGLVPLAVLDDAGTAVPLAKALQAGGVGTMEITFRTACARDAIAAVKQQVPGFIPGAGTVLSVEQAKEAVEAGADYIVTPGFDAEIVDWCRENGVAVVPGCVTPTEVQQAVKKGLTVLKFFPAERYGGVKTCASLVEPFRTVKFMPTGGIGFDNLSDYVGKDFIFAVGGSWLCNKDDVKAGNWEKITAGAKASVQKLLGFQIGHVGINSGSFEEAAALSDELSALLGFAKSVGTASTFVGTAFEINHSAGRGAKGHVSVNTNSIPRAEYYLSKMGVKFDEKSRVSANGKTVALYLEKEFGGFAVHLKQK